MLNYMHAELWRFFRRPAGKALLAVVIALPALMNLYVWLCNQWLSPENRSGLYDSLGVASILMPFAGVLLLMVLADTAFADERRLGTLKNAVSAGFPRPMLYFGKLLSGLLLAFAHLAAAWLSFAVSGLLLLPYGGEYSVFELAKGAGLLILQVIPLWLGVFGILHLLYFTFRNGLMAMLAAALGSFVISTALLSLNDPAAEMLSQCQLLTYLYSVVLEDTLSAYLGEMRVNAPFLAQCWLAGGGYFLSCTVLGFVLFRRRDID